MEKEELEKILSTLPPGTKVSVQDELRTYDIEAVGLKSKELFLIVGNGEILDLAGLAEMGIQFIGPREIPEEDIPELTLGPQDWIIAGLEPLPEPEPTKQFNQQFDKKVIKRLVKTVVCKSYPNRNLGLIRGRGGKKK
jgi:hypothetical protein